MNTETPILRPTASPMAMPMPIHPCRASTGFPSPADDYMEGKLDLNEHLVNHPTATFFLRASGLSQTHANIHPDDIIVVDRSLTPANGKIVVAEYDGGLIVRRLQGEWLMGKKTKPIKLDENIQIFGCVTYAIHKVF